MFTKCALFPIIRIERRGRRIDCVGISMPGSVSTAAGPSIQRDNKVTYQAAPFFALAAAAATAAVSATGILFFSFLYIFFS